MKTQNTIWFGDIEENDLVQEGDFKTFEQIVSSSIQANKFNPSKLSITDSSPRIVFITIGEFSVTATVFYGQAQGLMAAFEAAFKKVKERFDCRNKDYIIKIDIVVSARVQKDCNSSDTIYNFTRGIEGIAFDKVSNLAILPEQISCNFLWNNNAKMLPERLHNYLENNPPESHKLDKVLHSNRSSFDVYFFKTKSFVLEKNNLKIIYRGQFLFESFSNENLKESINLAGKYLINSILPNGRYDYIYYVTSNFSDIDYNFLRHAGTCFSLAEYFEFSNDQECLPALNRALDYMRLFSVPGLEDPQTTCFVERGLATIGSNGLAALALAKYMKVTNDKKDQDLLTRMCNWILTQIADDGNFKGHKQRYHTGNYTGSEVLYYPGEVIYGLVMSYNLLKEHKWIDGANKIANWIITVRDSDLKPLKLEHDHWMLYGLNELYRITPNQIYIDYTAKICQAIMHRQILESQYPDYLGAHNNNGDPSSTQAATRSEGLLAAYKLLKDFGNMPEFTDKVLEYAKRSVAFQLRTQYTKLNTIYVRNAKKALGGFRQSINSHHIRIDYVQHNLSSLISLYNLTK